MRSIWILVCLSLCLLVVLGPHRSAGAQEETGQVEVTGTAAAANEVTAEKLARENSFFEVKQIEEKIEAKVGGEKQEIPLPRFVCYLRPWGQGIQDKVAYLGYTELRSGGELLIFGRDNRKEAVKKCGAALQKIMRFEELTTWLELATPDNSNNFFRPLKPSKWVCPVNLPDPAVPGKKVAEVTSVTGMELKGQALTTLTAGEEFNLFVARHADDIQRLEHGSWEWKREAIATITTVNPQGKCTASLDTAIVDVPKKPGDARYNPFVCLAWKCDRAAPENALPSEREKIAEGDRVTVEGGEVIVTLAGGKNPGEKAALSLWRAAHTDDLDHRQHGSFEWKEVSPLTDLHVTKSEVRGKVSNLPAASPGETVVYAVLKQPWVCAKTAPDSANPPCGNFEKIKGAISVDDNGAVTAALESDLQIEERDKVSLWKAVHRDDPEKERHVSWKWEQVGLLNNLRREDNGAITGHCGEAKKEGTEVVYGVCIDKVKETKQGPEPEPVVINPPLTPGAAKITKQLSSEERSSAAWGKVESATEVEVRVRTTRAIAPGWFLALAETEGRAKWPFLKVKEAQTGGLAVCAVPGGLSVKAEDSVYLVMTRACTFKSPLRASTRELQRIREDSIRQAKSACAKEAATWIKEELQFEIPAESLELLAECTVTEARQGRQFYWKVMTKISGMVVPPLSQEQ